MSDRLTLLFEKQLTGGLTASERLELMALFHLSKEARDQVRSLTECLTPRQKEVFLLSREHGLHNGEIAQRIGMDAGSVEAELAEALKFLRRALKEQYGWQATGIFVVYGLGKY